MKIRDNKQVIDSNRSSFQFESVFEVHEIKLIPSNIKVSKGAKIYLI